MPNTTLPYLQKIFTLAMLAERGACHSGSAAEIESAFAEVLDKLLSDLQLAIGRWSVVWGPAVYQAHNTTTTADNVMYVVQRQDPDPDLPELVVAIAGTNMASDYDLLVENAWVSTLFPWVVPTAPSDAQISMGAMLGLVSLMQLRPSPGLAGPQLTLTEFLTGFLAGPTKREVKVGVCGHSLGGALASTMALWLYDTQATWDSSGKALLSALAVAGPTAGNKAFADYSNARLGQQITRLYNPLDVIPHAWNSAALGQLLELYSPTVGFDAQLLLMIYVASQISKDGDYTQIGTDYVLDHRIHPEIAEGGVANNLPWPEGLEPTELNKFLVQMAYQHVAAYCNLLKIPLLFPFLLCPHSRSDELDSSLARLQGKLARYPAPSSPPGAGGATTGGTA